MAAVAESRARCAQRGAASARHVASQRRPAPRSGSSARGDRRIAQLDSSTRASSRGLALRGDDGRANPAQAYPPQAQAAYGSGPPTQPSQAQGFQQRPEPQPQVAYAAACRAGGSANVAAPARSARVSSGCRAGLSAACRARVPTTCACTRIRPASRRAARGRAARGTGRAAWITTGGGGARCAQRYEFLQRA